MTSMLETQKIIYPERDGKRMSDNTKQFRWIQIIESGLESFFKDRPDVFVAGDLLWYPVEGKPKIRVAPDALVVFGRPKGDRGSYRQWEEENIPPQVVFEVLSPGNTKDEMSGKRNFYEEHGVEEYYIYDPESFELTGWIRLGERLEPLTQMKGWSSPLLELRFELDGLGGELKLHRPDGKPFATAEQLQQAEERAEEERLRAERAEESAEQKQQQIKQERQRVERAEESAEQKQQQIKQERQRAERAEESAEQKQQQIEQERQRAERAEESAEQKQQQIEQERQRAERLLARLKAEGIELDEL